MMTISVQGWDHKTANVGFFTTVVARYDINVLNAIVPFMYFIQRHLGPI